MAKKNPIDTPEQAVNPVAEQAAEQAAEKAADPVVEPAKAEQSEQAAEKKAGKPVAYVLTNNRSGHVSVAAHGIIVNLPARGSVEINANKHTLLADKLAECPFIGVEPIYAEGVENA